MAWTGRSLGLGLARWSPLPARAGAARSVWLPRSLGSINFSTKEKADPTNQPLEKPKLPVGRFDETEESNVEMEPLEKLQFVIIPLTGRNLEHTQTINSIKEFPDGINPVTKEKGGPKGPEPTRYGDWERKGRCIDF